MNCSLLLVVISKMKICKFCASSINTTSYNCIISDTWCLKLRHFSVPAVVMRGNPAWLNCSYDLEHDKLYSIKWHKNNVEFYRYLPADTPPGQKYELAGIYLEVSMFKMLQIY